MKLTTNLKCPTCGRKLTPKVLNGYEVGPLVGMRSVLINNLGAFVCSKDKSVLVPGLVLEMIHERLMTEVLSSSHVLCGEEVRFIRKALGLSQAAFADRLGVHRVTVARWETGEVALDGPTSVAIRALAAIPMMADASRAKEHEAVKRSFETAPAAKAPESYTLTASST